jgi:hypothetical protein
MTDLRRYLIIASALAWPALSWAGPKSPTQELQFTPRYVSPELMESVEPIGALWDRHIQVRVGYSGDIHFTQRQEFHATAGYQFKFIGVSSRLSLSHLKYSNFVPKADSAVDPTDPDLPMFANPASEWNRPRSAGDTWTALTLDLGLEYQARLLAFVSPRLLQRARWSIGRGVFVDHSNGISFCPTYYRVEVGTQYSPSLSAPWSIDLAMAYSFGQLLRNTAGASSLRKLPLMWVDWTLGFSFGF